MNYKDVSSMMEEYARSLDYSVERLNAEEFTANGVHFRRTNIWDWEMVMACKNKVLTGFYVRKAKVRTPKGVTVHKGDSAPKVKFPVVVKASDGTGGVGVTTNIQTQQELEEAIAKARRHSDTVIVEEHITGTLYRVFVASGKVVSVLKQLPPNVVGDGVSTLEALIAEKNGQRNPPASMPLKVGFNLDVSRVPEEGEFVALHPLATRAIGGDVFEVLDEMPQSFKTACIKAVNSIPNLRAAGIDVIFDGKSTTVIEINSQPHITAHYHNLSGISTPIHEFIVDAYVKPDVFLD